jgi:hypothetical protein
MFGIYPVNSFLHRVKKVNSPKCVHCNRGQVESMSHFLKVCPKFHHARTTVHNRVRHAFFQMLKKHASRDWELREETPLSLSTLRLKTVPTVQVQQAGRADKDSDNQAGRMCIDR